MSRQSAQQAARVRDRNKSQVRKVDDTYYVLVCRDCYAADRERVLPMPFASAEARGKWASEHTLGTGHDNFAVVDQPRSGLEGVS